MRAILLRVGALGTVVALGWITIAHAQRGESDPFAEPHVSQRSNEGFDSQIPSQPASLATLPPEVEDANPLRDASLPSERANKSNSPMNDPFGLRSQSGQKSDAVVVTSSEQPATGPALNNDRVLPTTGNRYPNGNNSRHSPAVQNSKASEPAPFQADPFAMPTHQNSAPAKGSAGVRGVPQGPTIENTPPTVAGEEGTGQPGGKQFEGIQSPQVSIQKVAPQEIQVGRPVAFRVIVRNTGQVPACEVEIHDFVPKGTQLLGTTPQATVATGGKLVWKLGVLQPGEETAVEMQLMPIAEGEIGSVATVHFGADATARSICTRPRLAVETSGPAKVLIGEKAVLTITVSNPGTGIATGVVVEEKIPPGFEHPAGSELEYEVGTLKPGESRKLELPLIAKRPGPVTNILSVRGEGNLRAEHRLNIEVLAPLLDVAVEGPKRRYLERQAVYHLSVTNPGTAPAKHVELVANLPPSLKFVSANNAGYYEESTRTVRWRLEELPANETGSVELVTIPIEPGQHALKLRGTAQPGLTVEKEQPVIIEGIAAVMFQVADTIDPVEIGGETIYEIRVVNQGSKSASNVRLAAQLPMEMKPLAAEGPVRYAIEADRVIFDSLARLSPKAEVVYRVRAKAVKSGDLRARFQLMTDDMQMPVTKEESTRVFAEE